MRFLFGFLCVCGLGVMPLVGCGESAGDGGSGGSAGSGGDGGEGGTGSIFGADFANAARAYCMKLDECPNVLIEDVEDCISDREDEIDVTLTGCVSASIGYFECVAELEGCDYDHPCQASGDNVGYACYGLAF